MSNLPQSHVLHDTYEIKSTLGQGGFGITYYGVDLLLNSEVAIKEYFPRDEITRLPNNTVVTRADSQASFKLGLDRFLQEARIIASLKNHNIMFLFVGASIASTGPCGLEVLTGASKQDTPTTSYL